MAINNFLSGCGDCDTNLVLGKLPVKQRCTAYAQRYSQVRGLLIKPKQAATPLDFTDAKNPTIVSGEIDNTDETGGKSKLLYGEGSIGEPDFATDDYPDRQQRDAFGTWTLEHIVKSLDDDTYAFLQKLQCGDASAFNIYYDTVGDYLYGNGSGIVLTSLRVTMPKGGGRDDKEFATIRVTWEADGDPPRANSPLPTIAG